MNWKFWLGVIVTFSLIGIFSDEAIAAQCQTVDTQEICLVSIKRSAKYHWQYRAELKINGKRYPSEKFDCRDTTQTKLRQGDRAQLQKQKRDFVCGLVPKR